MIDDKNGIQDIVNSRTKYRINKNNMYFDNHELLIDYDKKSIYLLNEKLIKLWLTSNTEDVMILKEIIQNSSKPISWKDL